MSGPPIDTEIFHPGAFDHGTSTLIQQVMAIVSPPVGDLLGALDCALNEDELADHSATPDRMERLAALGLVEDATYWDSQRAWRRTEKGTLWYRVWFDEIGARRERAKNKGPFLDLELDQIPENATIRKMTGGGYLIQVPHDPVARDLPWEPPADMVTTLGLLAEGSGVSVQYLVGANPEATTAARVETILPMLEAQGLAVQLGHGWARTMRGTRMYATWSGAPGSTR